MHVPHKCSNLQACSQPLVCFLTWNVRWTSSCKISWQERGARCGEGQGLLVDPCMWRGEMGTSLCDKCEEEFKNTQNLAEKLEVLKSPSFVVRAARPTISQIFGRTVRARGAVFRLIYLSLAVCAATRRSA